VVTSAALTATNAKGPLNGPNATGNHCPEGWTIYQYPGPGFEGIGENSAESSYYTWVDQHNTFGLGEKHTNVHRQSRVTASWRLKDGQDDHDPDSLSAQLLCQGFRWGVSTIRMPAWKGPRVVEHERRPHGPWLKEGGKGSRPRAVHIQFRPDPLAN